MKISYYMICGEYIPVFFLCFLLFECSLINHFLAAPLPQRKKVAFEMDSEGQVEMKKTLHAEMEQHEE